MRRCTAFVVVGLALAMTAGAALAVPPDVRNRYAIIRNGSQIGTHAIRFRNTERGLIVTNRVRIRVMIAFIEAYRYNVDETQRWDGDQLLGVRAQTDKNGDDLSVRVDRGSSGFRIQRPGGTGSAPADTVIDSPPWNVLERRPTRMIDSEDGRVMNVRVSRGRNVTLEIRHRRYPCRRFDIRGDLHATMWYGEDGTLVKKSLRAPDDSTVVTVLR